MVISLIELTFTLRSRGEILELLRYCVDSLQTKPGCMGSGVYEAGDQKQTILYLERWSSAEELHRHIQSNLYLGVLTAMDFGQRPAGYPVLRSRRDEVDGSHRLPQDSCGRLAAWI